MLDGDGNSFPVPVRRSFNNSILKMYLIAMRAVPMIRWTPPCLERSRYLNILFAWYFKTKGARGDWANEEVVGKGKVLED